MNPLKYWSRWAATGYLIYLTSRLPTGDYDQAVIPQLLFLVLSVVLSALLTPKPKLENARPANQGDFEFPTATEGRILPVVFGTVKMKSPNVIWHGNIGSRAIEKTLKTGLWTKKTIKTGFEYFLGMDMALCHGVIDYVSEIQVGDRTLHAWPAATTGSRTGEYVPMSYPTLFGGYENGGGLKGQCFVYNGHANQEINDYVSLAAGGVVPAYNNVAHVVWHGNTGESPRVEPWAYKVSRYPNQLGITGDMHIVGTGPLYSRDANPACVLFEILTGHLYGLNISQLKIDKDNFRAAGETLYNEGNGFGLLVDSEKAASEVIEEVLRQIDAAMYEDSDGLYRIKLFRNDYALGSTPVFDEDNIMELKEFGRTSWHNTVNHVELRFRDREQDYKQTGAVDQDLANIVMQGGHEVIGRVNFPGVKDRNLAQRLAARELHKMSFPLAKVTLIVNRDAGGFNPGDVFRFSWSIMNISLLPMRVLSVDRGKLAKGQVQITATQDIFGLETVRFAPAPITSWTPPDGAALPATVEKLFDLPVIFPLTDITKTGIPGEWPMSLVERPSDSGTFFDIWEQEGTEWYQIGTSNSFTPTGRIQTEVPNTGASDGISITIYNVVDPFGITNPVHGTDATGILQFGRNMLLVGDELMAYETVTDNLDGSYTLNGVTRALVDTVYDTHPVDRRVWFFSIGSGLTEESFAGTSSLTVRHSTRTPSDLLDVEDASNVAITFTRRSERPIRPANMRVDGHKAGEDIEAGDPGISWAHRRRDNTTFINYDTPGGTIESTVNYYAAYKKVTSGIVGATIHSSTAIAAAGYARTRAQILSDFGGVIGSEDELQTEVYSIDTGTLLQSHQTNVVRVSLDPGGTAPSTDSLYLDNDPVSNDQFVESDDALDTILGEADPTAFSVAFWLKEGTGAAGHIAGASHALSDAYPFRFSRTGAPGFELSVGEPTNLVTVTPSHTADSSWHHIVCIFDAANAEVAVWLDGVKTSTSTTLASINVASLPLVVGNTKTDGSYDGCDGNFDDVVLYERALNAREVKFLYNGGTGSLDPNHASAPPDLELHWECGENVSDDATAGSGQITDTTGNGNHGTPQATAGAPAFQVDAP